MKKQKKYTISDLEDVLNECDIEHNGLNYLPYDYIFISTLDEFGEFENEKNTNFYDEFFAVSKECLYISNLGEETFVYNLGKLGEIVTYRNERYNGHTFVFGNKKAFNNVLKK